VSDSSGQERGPEGGDGGALHAEMEAIRQQAQPFVEQLAQQLHITEDDVRALAVILFAQYLDPTNRPDTITLVCTGTVTPYDSALKALIAQSPLRDQLGALMATHDAAREESRDND